MRKESLSGPGNKSYKSESGGVMSGLSMDTKQCPRNREYGDGVVNADNVMASGKGGYSRASKRATSRSVGGFTIDDGRG